MTAKRESMIGLLNTPDGHREPAHVGGRERNQLLDWYHKMLLIRRTEEVIAGMVESGEAVCPCHLAIGQEAAAVGVASALNSGDRSFGAHRSHSHYLALGAPVRRLLAEVLGKETGCSRGYGGSMHLRAPEFGLVGTVPIVGATIAIAVGAALALKRDGRNAVAISFLGDGASEEGIFHESLNLAASMSLPVFFVVENNLYASHLHIDLRQPANSIARFAVAHCIESAVVDGNDVGLVATQTERLVDIARTTGKPVLLEAVTYRWRGHVGHREDSDVGVERKDNLPEWKKRDPIARLRTSMLARGDITADDCDAISLRIERDLIESLEFARNSSYPAMEDMTRIVYSDRFDQ